MTFLAVLVGLEPTYVSNLGETSIIPISYMKRYLHFAELYADNT